PLGKKGSILFFSATEATHGFELWRSDGTKAGTRLVKDINQGPDPSYPSNLVSFHGLMWFSADDGQHGSEVWTTDGTKAGTKMFADLQTGPTGSAPGGFTVANGLLYFSADDGSHGREPWETDGTTTGTKMIKGVAKGPASSSGYGSGDGTPTFFRRVGTHVVFAAWTAKHGFEPWRTDGTAGTTIMLKDTKAGSADGISDIGTGFAPIGTTKLVFQGGGLPSK